MRWFRLYSEIIHDPKVQLLPATTFKEWINVLCVACENNGQLPSDQDVAFSLRMTVSAARAMLLRLLDAKLLERTTDGNLRPHNWDSRQFQSDVSTKRVQRFRERKKTVTRNGHETFHETELKRPRARDTDTDTDTDKTPLPPFDPSEILQAIQARHPRSEGVAVGIQILGQAIAESTDPQTVAISIDIRHRDYVASIRDPKYAKSLANWARDKMYLDPPSKNGSHGEEIDYPT